MKTLLLPLTLSLLALVPAQAQNAVPNPASTAPTLNSHPPQPSFAPMNPNAISPAEWQELRTAHAAALKANPTLALQSQKLAQDMHAFLLKLNAAILQTDPTVAPIVARMQGGPPGPKMQPLPAPPQTH